MNSALLQSIGIGNVEFGKDRLQADEFWNQKFRKNLPRNGKMDISL